MPRMSAVDDFHVDVEGVGHFVFAKRKMRDEVKIQVEFARMIEGVEPTEWLKAVCGWMSTLSVLTVAAPAEWDMEEMDPLEDEVYTKLSRVHEALRDKERSFRGGKKPVGERGSEAAV